MNNNIDISAFKPETLSNNQIVSNLNVDIKNGLSSDEAKKRQEQFGLNKLKENKKKSVLRIFFEQMKNPMIYVLFAAIAITIAVSVYESVKNGWDFLNVGDWPDVIIIIAVILLNSVIGTIQEKKADSSLEQLKKLSSPLVNVIRDGNVVKIKSEELTIGDLVLIEDGDIIGADIRLIETHNLKINESSLTGESVPILKNSEIVFSKEVPIGDKLNMAYSSTNVTYGRGKGIVTSIGMKTEIGKIAKSIDNNEEELTPLQKVLEKLSKFLGILTIGIVLAVLIVEIIWLCVRGHASVPAAWTSALLDSIALAVAAIPEGLVAVVTIVLSLGVTRMVKANTIVRKLPSVETLGSVNVICSDKTGTLTQNKMTVVGAYTLGKKYDQFEKNNNDLKFLSTGFALCSNATLTYGDPTEIALIDLANKIGLTKENLEKEFPRVDELPFDSDRKMMSTKNGEFIFTKGSLDSIIKNSKYILDNGKVRQINKEDIKTIYEMNNEFSSKALRVLALGYIKGEKIVEKDLIFVGLVAMIDPPRAEVKGAVSILNGAGIRTVMITGDHKDTAFAIAKELGIANNPNECISGIELDKLSSDELKETVKSIRVFARVSPKNKVDIVKAIKANDNIVAMTGDGVNDAPSLKGADIGIAMGITGTDVAKDASDMVLTDDNFASIEKAVEEGRSIFKNIRKTVLFLLSSNISEVLSLFLIVILGLPTPLIAIHLLWINLITDSVPAIALGMDPKDKDIMKEKPRNKKDNFLSHGGLNMTVFYGGIITISVIVAYFIPAWQSGVTGIGEINRLYENNNNLLMMGQTMAFSTLAIAELFHMLGMSAMDKPLFKILKNKNILLIVALVVGIALQFFVVSVPGVNKVFKTYSLSGMNWLYVFLLALLPLLAHELIVLIKFIIKKRKN